MLPGYSSSFTAIHAQVKSTILGGGRKNSVSILETIDLLADMGHALRYEYVEGNRMGDHICYISKFDETLLALPTMEVRV
jgi:CDP-paratose 2-epimerase